MRGISEERLVEWAENHSYKREIADLLDECTELNPWIPIDENTPKDVEIVVYAPSYQDLDHMVSICKFHESAGFCINELRQPTHWMPLPEPPK